MWPVAPELGRGGGHVIPRDRYTQNTKGGKELQTHTLTQNDYACTEDDLGLAAAGPFSFSSLTFSSRNLIALS